ncbi:MAG: hypothetical protein IJ740_20110 [Ruminococcus sp.]|nr:hypothetical protein [Ruminococcus sp.]MBR1753150.1 hypothetical protein [Ruminococcus sp.]
MEKKTFKRNENGAVLLTVLCVMTMMIVLVGAAISFVNMTSQRTYKTFQSEQAYMTASTCLESFVKEIENTTNGIGITKAEQKQAIDYLRKLSEENGGKGYEYDVLINSQKNIDKMGSCTIKVSKYTDQIIVITAKAKFGSEEDQVAAYVVTETDDVERYFQNAIEICQDADHEYNNLRVVGGIASITGSNKDVTYKLTNGMQVNGPMFFYGDVEANPTFQVVLSEGFDSNSRGSSVTVSGDLSVWNTPFIKAVLAKDNTNEYNYVNIGGTLKSSANGFEVGNRVNATTTYDVDIYCSGAELTGNKPLEQYGNLYVYNDMGNGDLVTGGVGEVNIHGDLVVEGDIINNGNRKIVVDGDITYVGDVYKNGTKLTGSAVTGAIQAGGNINKVDAADIVKEGRAKRPAIRDTCNEYKYNPEDIIRSTKTDNGKAVGSLKSAYDAFYTGSTTATLKSLFTQQVTNDNHALHAVKNGQDCIKVTDNGITTYYDMVIDENCTISQDDINFLYQPMLDSVGGPNSTQYPKILIHVTDENLVIRLGSLSTSGRAPQFIIKNDSPDSAPKFCYFVSDSGQGNADADPQTGFSTCSYYWDNATFMDYNTYVNLYDPSVFDSFDQCLLNAPTNSSFYLNTTDEDIPGAFQPDDEKIYYFLTKGCSWSGGNNSFIEGIMYAPDASVDTRTQGISIPHTYISKSTAADNYSVCSLGMIVAGDFQNSNLSYYVFNSPHPASAFSITKGNESDQIHGYNILRYDHH